MNSKKTLRRDLRYSSTDSLLSSIMVGAGETFLPAFALAVGASAVTAGLIAAIPFLIGSIIQLLAPRGLEKVGSYRKFLVSCGILQAFCFIPLVLVATTTGKVSDWVLYLIVTIYWACGLASGPAWSSWMTAVVPSAVRARYFAKRNRLGQLGLLIGLCSGGCLLHFAKQLGLELHAFAGLFLISGLFRFGSAFCVGRQSERPSLVREQRRLPLMETIMRLRTGNEAHLIGFLLIFTVAVQLAAPFFTPFMLSKLKLSYGAYMILTSASFLAKIGAFAFLGRYAKDMNPFKLIRIGVIGGSLLPITWAFSQNYTYLFMTQIINGAVWACFDLGVLLAFFGIVRNEERTSVMSLFNFATALMTLIGSALGGELLRRMGESMNAYFVLFGLATIGRLLCLKLFENAARNSQLGTASVRPTAAASTPAAVQATPAYSTTRPVPAKGLDFESAS